MSQRCSEHASGGVPALGACGVQLLPDVIDPAGVGYAQLKVGALTAGVFLADGSELLLITSVASAVAKEWELSPCQRGGLVSAVVFLGVFVGNLVSGPLGDTFGRRRLLIASYMGIAGCSVLSSAATSVWMLAAVRVLVGVSIGFGQPASLALSSEHTPTSWRIPMMTATIAFFTIGEIYGTFLLLWDDPSLGKLHWRSLLRWGALPAMVLSLASLMFLNESPSFLALHNQAAEARADAETSGESLAELLRRQMDVVFGGGLLATTAVVTYSCFILNLNYYGTLYAFPQVLPQLIHEAAASELLIGALWELPGLAMGLVIGMTLSRKGGVRLYLGLMALSLLAFAFGAAAKQRAWGSEALLYAGYYGVKCFVNIGFIIIYQYAVEVYPTEARVTGTAFCLAGGRVAAMLSPLAYEFITGATGDFRMFFVGIAVLTALNAFLVGFLPYETAGSCLKDFADLRHHDETDIVLRTTMPSTTRYGSTGFPTVQSVSAA